MFKMNTFIQFEFMVLLTKIRRLVISNLDCYYHLLYYQLFEPKIYTRLLDFLIVPYFKIREQNRHCPCYLNVHFVFQEKNKLLLFLATHFTFLEQNRLLLILFLVFRFAFQGKNTPLLRFLTFHASSRRSSFHFLVYPQIET
jgi:hypothetical protein